MHMNCMKVIQMKAKTEEARQAVEVTAQEDTGKVSITLR